MSGIVSAAFRNFTRNLKRYQVLLIALICITAALVMVLSVVLGMREKLYEKASRYFAGNIVVLGFADSGDREIEDPETVLQAVQALEDAGADLKAVSRRSSYSSSDSIELFFSGYYTRQRKLAGVEWELERPVLEDFDFVSGSVPEAGDETAALISTAAAEELQIAVGDTLLVSIKSDRGRVNTAELTVRGIFAESSFFGYQTYLHRRTLNRLREAPEDNVDEMGVYLEHSIANEDWAAAFLAGELGKKLPVFGVIEEREAYSKEASRKRNEREYGVFTVGAQLEEIEDLMAAISVITGAVMLMFLAIVMVGVSNTFTMIVWERTREIGTLRALGMQRHAAVISFLLEAVFLGLGGLAAGSVIGVAVLEAVRRGIQFPPNMVTSLFLTRGRIHWVLPLWGILAIAALVIAASAAGSLRAAIRAGKLPPADALRHQK